MNPQGRQRIHVATIKVRSWERALLPEPQVADSQRPGEICFHWQAAQNCRSRQREIGPYQYWPE